MSIQLDLFDYLEQLVAKGKNIEDYYHEFQSLAIKRRNHAGYGGDKKSEANVLELDRKGHEMYGQWKKQLLSDTKCWDGLLEIIVQLWCIKVNGEVNRDLFASPASPKVYTPQIDNHLHTRIPPQLKLPPRENILIARFESYDGNQQDIYHVLYVNHLDHKWYDATVLYDHRKGKWSDIRISCTGAKFRADLDYQWWTQEGFDKAKADNRLDPQIAAVWTNYIRFYGRNEALERLGLPLVSSAS